jgi:hypothetical protein
MIATSNFINVTGAIAASGLFFVLVMLARRCDFVEQLPQTDHFATGTLTKLERNHGRPAYFEVINDAGVTSGGKIPDPQPSSVMDQIFGGNRPKDDAVPIVLHVRRGVNIGARVVVCRYRIAGVDHLKIRREEDPLRPAYDSHLLPRFLFIGAGLMTLTALLILWRRMPDLFVRAIRVCKGLFGRRTIVSGVHHLPNDGPVVLITTNTDASVQRAIMSATDRYTKFFNGDPNTWDAAVKMLDRGGVIGLVLDGEKSEPFFGAVTSVAHVNLLPVFAGVEGQSLIVVFDKTLPGTATVSEVRSRIEKARFEDEY